MKTRGRHFPRPLVAACGVAVAAALGVAGYALAANVGITLTASGPNPATVNVALGDTITVSNGDAVPRVFVLNQLHLNSGALMPGATSTYVVTSAGKFSYNEENDGGKEKQPGVINVSPTGSVTIAGLPIVLFQQPLLLTGKTSLPGFPVKIESQAGKRQWVEVSTVNPEADGSFSFLVRPTIGTVYRADVFSGQLVSVPLRVDVKPRLSLHAATARVRTGAAVRLVAHVTPANAADSLGLRWYDKSRKSWVQVAEGRVNRLTGTAVFSWTAAPGRSLLRTWTTRGLTHGFIPSFSQQIVVTGVGPAPVKLHRPHKHHRSKRH